MGKGWEHLSHECLVDARWTLGRGERGPCSNNVLYFIIERSNDRTPEVHKIDSTQLHW